MVSNLLRAFGAAVRTRRESLGISQEQLGYRSRSHRNYIGAVERGERNLTLSKLVAISEALELGPDELLRIGIEPKSRRRGGL